MNILKHITKRLYILLIMGCSAHAVQSSQESPHTLRHLSVEDGLSSNYVVSVAQDRKGYIWVATSSGLNRFDGREFIVYTKNNSNLDDNDLHFIYGDPTTDLLWIATLRNGLYYFDYTTETIFPVPAHVQDRNITHLSEASDNGIWITYNRAGIAYYNHENNIHILYSDQNVEGFINNNNTTAVEDGKGNLYVGHDSGGLSVISLNNKISKNYKHDPSDNTSIPSNVVHVVYIDKDENVWVGTDNGLALFDRGTEKFITFKHKFGNKNSLLSNHIFDIKQMKDGTLWIGTNMGGVSILDLQKNVFTSPENVYFQNIEVTNDHFGLSGPNVHSILQDSYGNIWLGNYRGGVDFIAHSQPYFRVLPYSQEKKNKQVWGIWNDNANGHLWMSGEGKIGIYNESGIKINAVPLLHNSVPLNTHANAIIQDRNNNFWFGTYKSGVLFYSQKDKTMKRINSAQYDNLNVYSIYEDDIGKIWIGAQTGVFSYYDNNFIFENEINEQLPERRATGILKDVKGRLWISTFGKGVTIFDTSEEKIKTITTNMGFASNAVNHMIRDSRNRIIAATTDGLILFHDIDKPEKYTFFGADHGLENTQVRAIQEDLEQNIWLSTNGGIAMFNETESSFLNYNYSDGVPQGDFMNGSTSISDNGTIYFGSQGGVCYFTPRLLSTYRKTIPVAITRFIAYPKEAKRMTFPVNTEEINLPYSLNTFSINFNVLDFSQSSLVEFSYMLKGTDDTWYYSHNDNEVTFRNIPPGNYTFKIKSRFRHQEWDDSVTDLKIRIHPPFWKTWYAKLFYFSLICSIIFFVIRFYKRKNDLESSLEIERREKMSEQQLNSERLQFYTNITHELRTPLTLIIGPLEDLLGDKNLSRKYAYKVNIIHRSAKRLLDLVNRILELRKTESQSRKLSVSKANLATFIREIGLQYNELNTNDKVSFHLDIDDKLGDLYFDPDVITIILDNLLSNSMKYTLEGEITLSVKPVVKEGNKFVEINVADTGLGINDDELPYIFNRYYQVKSKNQIAGSGIGLALVKDLANLHELSLDVTSTPGIGSIFTLRMRMDNEYPNAYHLPVKEGKILKSINNPEDDNPILLIVEDNAEIRDYVSNSFTEYFEVITAENGKIGWDLTQQYIPNIIISDIMMPIMDGFELCRLVKEDMRTSHIPVILLTAKDSIQDKEEGYTSGADSYITKPFSAKLIQSRVENLLESRQKLASLLADANTQNKHRSITSSLSKPDNEFLEKISSIIEQNIELENMNVEFIAEKMFMSHSTLYRKIKGLTNISVNEFIRKVKMRYSLKLLQSKKYTITEISYMTGFTSVAYFRKCFKDEYGTAPSKYVE